MKRLIVVRILVCFLLLGPGAFAFANIGEFPGRKIFTEVKYIEIGDLRKKFNKVTIVDVRSKYEHSTLRIKGAINIPLSSKDFGAKMKQLRQKTDRPIIVYCNGKTCMKSYKAARKAAYYKIDNVSSFDAGIMDWAKKYPKQAVLLGETLGDASKLISKDEFKKHIISISGFGDRVAETDDIVLDVQDRFQREGISIFIGREHHVTLDNFKKLDKYIAKAKRQKKGLLIYDAAGKQVRWLQYYLQKKNVKNYYFMKGGIHAYYKDLTSTFTTKKKASK